MEGQGHDSSHIGDPATVANACNWLRLIFHSLTCNRASCQLGERCRNGKLVLSHLVTCTASPVEECEVPSCVAVRRLALHWAECKNEDCRLCSAVWRDLLVGGGAAGHQHAADPHSAGYSSQLHTSPVPPVRTASGAHQEAYDAAFQGTASPLAPGSPSVYHHQHHYHGSPGGVQHPPQHPNQDHAGGNQDHGYHHHEQQPQDQAYQQHLLQQHYAQQQQQQMLSDPVNDMMASAGAEGSTEHGASPNSTSSPPTAADQLQAASGYLKYLFYCLMCKEPRDPKSVEVGKAFWKDMLSKPMVLLPPAAPDEPPRLPAGRRLLYHRLCCRYPGCMLCRPTCDLFMPSPPPQQQTGWLVGTAGGYGTHTNYPNHLSQYRPGVLGGEHDVELPAESENMDAIVQALSFSLGALGL